MSQKGTGDAAETGDVDESDKMNEVGDAGELGMTDETDSAGDISDLDC